MQNATVDKAVLDASVVVRAGVDASPEARAWTQRLGRSLRAYAPDHLWTEVASALRRYVADGRMTRADGAEILATALLLPIHLQSTRDAAPAALELALTRGLSAYDAFYCVLAESLDAPLVTADRRLAEAAARAELIA